MGGKCCSERKGPNGIRQRSFGLFNLFGGNAAYTVADEVFKKYDKDGSGQLDTAELEAFFNDAFPDEKDSAIQESGECRNVDRVQALMDAVDLDGDGTVGMNEVRAFLRCYNPEAKTIKKVTALIIIDVQNDFVSGSLANPYNALEIVPLINGIRDKFDVVVISMDWHPHEHCSFVESCNAGKVPIVEELKEFDPFSSVTLKGDLDRDEHKQTLYPRHAVQNTDGGACHPDLVLQNTDDTIYKGTKANIDSYSAFFDNCKANDTGMTALLEEKGVTDVYCCGLVFDICVKSTALHGAELGFKMAVIEDTCRPLSQDNVQGTKKELADAGVAVLSLADAVEEVEAISANKDCTLQQYLTDVHKGKQAKRIHDSLTNGLSSHAQFM